MTPAEQTPIRRGRTFAPGCLVAWRDTGGRKHLGLVESHLVQGAHEVAVVWEGTQGQGRGHVLREVPLFLDDEIAAHPKACPCSYCDRADVKAG